MEIPFLKDLPKDFDFDFIVDGIFGFTFKGEIRSPFREIIEEVGKCSAEVVAVDVPSGWLCDEGNINNTAIPDVIISLTAPKKCSEGFLGYHYLAGRFQQKSIIDKYGLIIPEYEGCNQFAKI
mmetsp:Transcript_14073/g.12427  ORF Transcript_14073/g.12427 Transcript_14073/m.12427 type:complete len:123 (-) Transcript_14073:4-372(-)